MADLKPDDVRALLRECVTVVKPGEVLVLRFGQHFSMADAARVREHVRAFNIDSGTNLAVLIMAGCELAVMPATVAETPAQRRRRERIEGGQRIGA